MITPIVMLALMVGPYAIVQMSAIVLHRPGDSRRAGAIGLSLLFAFVGIGHFIQTESMSQMLPDWFPARIAFIYGTGVLELALAIGFFGRRTRRVTGIVAAGVLVVFFPAYVYAAMNHAPVGGYQWGPTYLLVRAPLQVVILAWVYWFTIRRPDRKH